MAGSVCARRASFCEGAAAGSGVGRRQAGYGQRRTPVSALRRSAPHFEAVIQTHPNNIQARFGLALTEEYDGWPSRAVVQYDRAAALDPTHFLIPIRAGLAMMYLADWGKRRRASSARSSSTVREPNGFYSLGILNWLRGRLDESVAAHREALKRGDQASYIWDDYAFVCIDLGLHDEARRGFERIAQLLRAPNFAPWKRLSCGLPKVPRRPRRKRWPTASHRLRRGIAC